MRLCGDFLNQSTESVLGRDSLRFLFLPVLLLFNDFFQQEGNFGAANEDNYREHFDWKGGGLTNPSDILLLHLLSGLKINP